MLGIDVSELYEIQQQIPYLQTGFKGKGGRKMTTSLLQPISIKWMTSTRVLGDYPIFNFNLLLRVLTMFVESDNKWIKSDYLVEQAASPKRNVKNDTA
jgi:hypothetical protein